MGAGIAGGLVAGLARTRKALAEKLRQALGRGTVDETAFQDVEEALLAADVGVAATESILAGLRTALEGEVRPRAAGPRALGESLKAELLRILERCAGELREADTPPTVVVVVGTNGSGKTTTVAKLAWRARERGQRVIIAAADTFRAAACEQLAEWGRRIGAEVVQQRQGADPAAVVFDSMNAARSRRADWLLVDTAGRLHTRVNLMEELAKVRRVIAREMPGAPHEVLLVLDGTCGQNGIAQARVFRESAGVSGIVVTKLDGTARGGVIVPISMELGIPVKFIGVGEGQSDLRPFDPREFAEALLGEAASD